MGNFRNPSTKSILENDALEKTTMKTTMKTLIIDSNSICYRLKHALENVDLSIADVETGIIFGFLMQVKKLAKKFQTNQFIFTWDVGGSFRREVYPDYKMNRRTKSQVELEDPNAIAFTHSCFKQFDLIRCEVLPKLGFSNIFSQKGIEADDLIAAILYEYTFEEKPLLVSTDSDLFQLLDMCDMCVDIKKPLVTKQTFEKKHNIAVKHWVVCKAMAGDVSDNIKGIQGVGIKTAIKYLHGNLDYFSKVGKQINTTKTKELIARNTVLVKLPLEQTILPVLQKQDAFDIINFLDICDTYDFASFTTKKGINEWKTLFNC